MYREEFVICMAMVRFTPPSSLLFINRAQPCKSDAKPPDLGVDTLTEASRSKTTVFRRERKHQRVQI
ncbi:hypothetical protein ACFXTO_037375 [Malus domestica]